MSSQRDPAPNRKLSRFQSNPGADPAGVEDDRGDDERADADRPSYLRGDDEHRDAADAVGDEETTCAECDAPAEYDDPAEALGHDGLPSVPLCYSHILEHK